jgi:hypothetical protein
MAMALKLRQEGRAGLTGHFGDRNGSTFAAWEAAALETERIWVDIPFDNAYSRIVILIKANDGAHAIL